MKNILAIITMIMLFAACANSYEDKADALIKESMKKTLFHPETYRPVSTVLDSAFSPFDDPAFYEKTLQLCKLGVAISDYDEKAKDAKTDIARYKDYLRIMYSSADKERLNQAQEEYNKYLEDKEKATKKVVTLGEEVKAEMKKKPQFIGCKAMHRFHANNNAGQTTSGEHLYLFDKDVKKIVAVYDTDSEEYKAVMLMYKMLKGEDVTGEDVSIEDL